MSAAQWSDRWVRLVLPLAAAHLLLFLSLQARPGAVGPVLWRVGPILIVLAAAILLAGALASAVFGRATWTWHRAAGLLGLLAIVGTMGVYHTYPSSHDFTPSGVEFRLPLDGPVTVAWGGATADVNYHVVSPGERWGYDLLIALDGRTARTDGAGPDDYHAYGRPVLAPADGLVIRVRDGVPDAVPGRANRRAGAGNHVVLEVAPHEYLFVAHLRSGSIAVRPGQRVRQGDVLGAVGNSGNTSEPHVHLHLQDSPYLESGEGIPMRFGDAWLANADPPVRRPAPEGGTFGGKYIGDVVISATETQELGSWGTEERGRT